LAVASECGNESSGFIKCGVFERDFEKEQINIQNTETQIWKQTQERVS